MSHILTRIGQLWRDRKIILRARPELKFENYELVQRRPQFSGIKKGPRAQSLFLALGALVRPGVNF